ncbi:MAG: flagellar motor protein MotB [Fuerstiella sp.]
MAKCEKAKNCSSGPNQSYLISFGDTMTALLAFFIILNTLAEEQTGANLHAGTGSFMEAVDKFGLAGKVSGELSALAFQQNAVGPKYIVPDPEGRPSEADALGPDDDSDNIRIVDRTKDDYQRFLQQLRQVNNLKQDRDVKGEVTFDILAKLPPRSAGTLINDELKAALTGVGPMLRRDDYVVEITVWTTTPSQSAWSRALSQSKRIHDEAVRLLRLAPNQLTRLTAVAQPWISKTVKRPTASVTLRRLSP